MTCTRTPSRVRSGRLPSALVLAATVALGAAAAGSGGAHAQAAPKGDLATLSLEQLGQVEITSVSKRAERLADAPAAVYVITAEHIRRSGATSIPEILRLAPNLQVARTAADSWAITARGFNSTSANKLLVLIDGRTVYTPLFSGVFWDVQDTFIDDIERIEVISGPGATLWGSNAVNGVINITTRRSSETTGALVRLGAGSEEADAGVRYGRLFGDAASYRVYAKGFDRDHTTTATGAALQDGWRKAQAGFRLDWGQVGDGVTLQGDVYDGSVDRTTVKDESISGGNLLARWSRELGEHSGVSVQAYVDHTRRAIIDSFGETLTTFDVEAQHRFRWAERHHVVWGAGVRYSRDDVTNRAPFAFLPAEKNLHIANLFAQDTIDLAERLQLTLGAKVEDNNYTGLEFQPTARLGWKVTDSTLLWSAVSRVVRIPSRLDRDFFLPGAAPFVIAGGPGFESETLIAYEVGYRATPTPDASLSVSAFYNDYDELRSIEAGAGGGPALFDNRLEGETWGVEAWGSYRVRPWWTLGAGFNWLRKDLRLKPGSRDAFASATTDNDPSRQFSLHSLMELSHGVELDLWLRAVDDLPTSAVPGYVSLDARVGWRPSDTVDISLVGTGLLDSARAEFGAAPGRAEVDRAVFLRLLWRIP